MSVFVGARLIDAPGTPCITYKSNPINKTEGNSSNNSYNLGNKPHQQTREQQFKQIRIEV